jgi:hypothetical protein
MLEPDDGNTMIGRESPLLKMPNCMMILLASLPHSFQEQRSTNALDFPKQDLCGTTKGALRKMKIIFGSRLNLDGQWKRLHGIGTMKCRRRQTMFSTWSPNAMLSGLTACPGIWIHAFTKT